jgi:hypothetical protein
MTYKISDLDKEEWATLCWLDKRGYAAGITKFFSENDDGGATCRKIAEHEAWEVSETIEEDRHSFLACNGSRSLAEKLFKFLNSIV